MKPDIRCNDNLMELKKIPSNSINLVYIDPPFRTNREFNDFTDTWKSMNEYLHFMKPRMIELQRVLKNDGAIYIHSDHHASHHLKFMMDEVFGEKNFINEIIWKRKNASAVVKSKARSFGHNHDTIFIYSNGGRPPFHLIEQEIEMPRSSYLLDKNGKPYKSSPIGGNVPKTIDRLLNEGVAYKTKNNKVRLKIYLKEHDGKVYDTRPIDNIWNDIQGMGNTKLQERTGYSTQKPEKLLNRIITASSNAGDTVLDAFAGSGTTCAVATKLGRKSICIDVNPKSCNMMKKRLKK